MMNDLRTLLLSVGQLERVASGAAAVAQAAQDELTETKDRIERQKNEWWDRKVKELLDQPKNDPPTATGN